MIRNIQIAWPLIIKLIKIFFNNYDQSYTTRRAIIWTMDLVLKGYLYGPIKKSGVIKFIDINFRIPDVPDGQLATAVANTNIDEAITIQPGVTSSNQAINYYGAPNSAIVANSIPYTEVDVNNDFGFITQIYTESEEV